MFFSRYPLPPALRVVGVSWSLSQLWQGQRRARLRPHTKTNNHSHLHTSGQFSLQFTSHACCEIVRGSQRTWRQPTPCCERCRFASSADHCTTCSNVIEKNRRRQLKQYLHSKVKEGAQGRCWYHSTCLVTFTWAWPYCVLQWPSAHIGWAHAKAECKCSPMLEKHFRGCQKSQQKIHTSDVRESMWKDIIEQHWDIALCIRCRCDTHIYISDYKML